MEAAAAARAPSGRVSRVGRPEPLTTLPWPRALRLDLSARDRPRRRARVHLRGRGGSREGRDRERSRSGGGARAGSWSGSRIGRPRDRGACRSTGVVGQVPPALVDLALWLADYYGSTPARALALVAPELAEAAEGAGAAGRAPVACRARPSRVAAVRSSDAAIDRIVAALDAGRAAPSCSTGRPARGRPRSTSRLARRRSSAAWARSCSCPRSRSRRRRVGRVRARFGDRVAILHSGLTEAERRDERERIASGEARIVVGARSAVFAPLRGLGLIVVDEEHDASYKQDSDPRYDARTLAVKRAALEGAVAVFGSATPRPESWATLERLELGGRIGGELPPVQVVDLRREAGYPLSAPLLAELRRVAERRRQGDPAPEPPRHRRRRSTAAPAAATIRCPELRRRARAARATAACTATTAAITKPAPTTCPACGSVELARLGAGTQVARARARARLPRARADPARRRHGHEPEQLTAALRRFARDATARCCSGRRWSRRAITSPASSWRR